MLLQLQDTAKWLSIMIVLCFSFCIPVISLWFKNAEPLPKLLGHSFFTTFLLYLAAVLVNHQELSAVLLQTAEPILLLLFFLIFAAKPAKRDAALFNFILILLPTILMIASIFSLPVRTILAVPLTSLTASAILSVAILYLLKNEKNETNLFFWSILFLLTSGFAQYYLSFGLWVLVAPILRLGAYTTFLVFFYHAFLKAQLDKVNETGKKLAVMNRSIDYEVKKRMIEVEKVNQNLLNISKTDSMSKVLNKGALLDSIDTMVNRKPVTEFSMLMLDIDNFKSINDTLGHVIGDKCIKMLAATARNNIRDFDLIGRYGGDEFVIVLPGTGTNQAMIIAERFRKQVELSDSPHYTISMGIASYPADGTNTKALIEAADEGLYKSKRKGRNAVSHRSFDLG